jgi:4-hydroxy-tetrahydrodipicolinate reductase
MQPTIQKMFGIVSKRIDKVPGTHTVTWSSEIDDIELKHTAHNRKGFALGAVMAAEWVKDKSGVFTMHDMLSFMMK